VLASIYPALCELEAPMSKRTCRFALTCLAFVASLPVHVCAKTATFEDNYAKAKANAAAGAGLAYDHQLGDYMMALADVMPGMQRCASSHGTAMSLHGYFQFQSATHYSVVLQPKNGFSDCVAALLENRHPPAPPTTPYLDPFDLNLSNAMSN
jgi:hypothetical protein